jgi:uncharacterized membrane protein
MIVLDYLAWIIGALGVAIITWGIAVVTVHWIQLELCLVRRADRCRQREAIRHRLGSYLLLGLEFLIAADIVQTIRDPRLEEIAVLAGIVAIRTVISYFLDRELSDLERIDSAREP